RPARLPKFPRPTRQPATRCAPGCAPCAGPGPWRRPAVSSRRRRAASRSAATAAPTPAAQIISSRETHHRCCRCSPVPAADVAPFRQDRREGPRGNIAVILTTGRPAALEPGATARVPLFIYQARTMLQFSRAHWSGSSLQKAVLLFILIAAAILGVYY